MSQARTPRFVSRLTRQTLALIMAGGRGSRLRHLTDWRAKPAVPFAGKFRIIDFPLSNCINSGIRRIGLLTQYKAHSLILHAQRGWSFLRGEFGEFVEILPAQQRIQETWYAGTADAIYQNIDIIRNHGPKFVLILAGDHVYKMDYGPMIAAHVDNKADLTVGAIEFPRSQASEFGVLTVDESGRIKSFDEKPQDPQPMPDNPELSLASMGIYVFNAAFLYELLIRDADTKNSSHDFGRDIVPQVIKKYRAFSYMFRDPIKNQVAYWRDVGTIDAFWKANLELIGVTPELNLYDSEWPIWTYQEQYPPAKFVFDDDNRRGMAVDSMVSGGCIISGSVVRHSLLFSNVKVNSYCTIQDSVILPEVSIGRRCKIQNAIIDKGCRIPKDMEIGVDLAKDRDRFYVSPGGVVLVTPDMLGQTLHHIR
ncbi:MAG: glucose-1-phosphate adenylyltransferase [Gammaproteobacteria bacterium]|jgi:glucose-1-phosphate adenylyltransferase|nr:glucose-1-phosphate adenylyltransferase [Gammaproteobacteria bacterium]